MKRSTRIYVAATGLVLSGAIVASSLALLVGTPISQLSLSTWQAISITALIITASIVAFFCVRSLRELLRKYTDLKEANQKLHSTLEYQIDAAHTDLRTRLKRETEAKRVALEATQAKSKFLADMTHELRTPLNGIGGMAQVLQKSALSSEQMTYVDTILSTSKTLGTLINDILDFSKVEAGKIDIEDIEFALLETVETTIDELTHSANIAKNQLVVNIDPELPRQVLSDPTRIKQVLRNLLSNANKFCNNGVISIQLSKQIEDHDQWLCFTVHDTGIGIAENKLATIFEAFSQEEASTTRRFGGTGLGLAVCKQLVELMGGTITASSQINFGSQFEFRIPLRTNHASEIIRTRNGPLTHIKPLIIDHNEVRCKAIASLLSSWCFDFKAATSLNDINAIIAALSDNLTATIEDYTCVIVASEDFSETQKVVFDSVNAKVPVLELQPLFHEEIDDSTLCRYTLSIQSPIKPSYLMDRLATAHGVDAVGRDERTDGDQVKGYNFEEFRVLLVDDNEVNRMVATLLLEDVNLEVDVAENGQEAVDKVRANSYDLVYMDCEMPLLNGFEATRKIRALEDSMAAITPIIAMTANAMKGDRDRCIESGMNDYIAKPIDAEELYQLTEKWLNFNHAKVVNR